MNPPKKKYDKVAEDEREKALPMFARYGGAWNEYNARISARQSITQMWLAATPLLVGATYASKDETLVKLAAFALPIVNALHAGLMWMHDEMMAKLHVYLIECERWKNDDKYMPSYHADKERGYLHLRQWQNYSFIAIAITFAVAAFLPAYKFLETPFQILYFFAALVGPFFYAQAITGRKLALALQSHRMDPSTTDTLAEQDFRLDKIESTLAEILRRLPPEPNGPPPSEISSPGGHAPLK